MGFLKRNAAQVLTVVLLLQAAMFYGFSRREVLPREKRLADYSVGSAQWKMAQELQLDQDTLDVLKADDILSRVYVNRSTGQEAGLFVAYFSTQRTGKTPHSPKNCLPGSGWVPTQSGFISIPIAGESAPIKVNRYVVSRGGNRSVVLYWYQGHGRVIASEYTAKLFTVIDSIRYNRSDTALVRVVVGVPDGGAQEATNVAVSFVQSFFESLRSYLPA